MTDDLLVTLAQTHPGIVRTLRVLSGELDMADDLPDDVRRTLAEHLRDLGDHLERDGVVIDGTIVCDEGTGAER